MLLPRGTLRPNWWLALLAAILLLSTGPLARAGGPRQARQEKGPTHLSPQGKGRRIDQMKRSPRRAGGLRGFRHGLKTSFGKTGPARRLGSTTVFVPGHTLGWRSLSPAVRHFLKNPANGEQAAIFVASEGQFRANSPRGRVLSEAEVRDSRLVTIEFSNPKGGQEQKSKEIAGALTALSRAQGKRGRRLPLNVVTHSAGDTHFRTALSDHVDPAAMGIKIDKVVAVGPVYDGTWTGNVGNSIAGRVMGMRQAASELAEGSRHLARLESARDRIDSKIEGARTDLSFEGAPTPRLKGKPRLGNGDGFVQSRRAQRPGTESMIIRGANVTPLNHLLQIRYPGTIMAIQEILTD